MHWKSSLPFLYQGVKILCSEHTIVYDCCAREKL